MRFRPEQHLRRQSDFRLVREKGRRINCGAFTLWCLRREASSETPSEESGMPALRPKHSAVSLGDVARLGVVASTAAVGHAVLRNRAKRRLRDIFRRHQSAVPAGFDVLLTARTAATLWSMTELEQKFVDACRQITPAKHG